MSNKFLIVLTFIFVAYTVPNLAK